MYTSVRGVVPDEDTAAGRPARTRQAVGSTVVLLGLTSLFTDVSSEMVAAILPVYATIQLGLTPLQFGVVDGLYQGATAVFRLGAGHLSDRTRRPKVVATAGYALSAACKLALLPVTGLVALTSVIAADRAGKGIRTAPRDAMIAAASPSSSLGVAFGVHRALDTVGAMAGPLLAFALLTALPGAYDAVFVTSFCFALVGLAVIGLLVRDPVPASPPAPAAPPTARRTKAVRVRDSAALLHDPGIRRICLVAGLLAALTVSDGFLYLSLERRDGIPVHLFPLLFLGTSAGYLLLAVPFGRLADRVGRGRVFLAGHVLLLGCYLVVLGPAGGPASVVVALLLLGSYYAATDGVLSALTSRGLPEALRSSGLALVQTVVALGKFGSALAFGALWTMVGREDALAVFAVALVIGLLVALPLLRSATRALR